MFPNKQVRDLVYQDLAYNDEVSDYPFNDRLLNMIQLYKLSGSPSITNKSKSKYNIKRKLKQMQIKNTTNMVIGGGIKERINYDTDGKS